ncbi:hypothetical protein CDL12_29253 [Handroanthus impetiginosus]|uniref:Uncharacterized protein n=1 Tax=Handroanthus impetiginosus TaxID=429701 RepID=A0A2G9FYX5_9LAMI|nr:hypothetical protein CDL12_29253 [Handroanthus impetiginosus]
MAHNKNTKESEGFCRKIYNAVSPFRSRISRVSHHPPSSLSITNDKKSTQNPKPVHVLHQPSLSKMVPVELEPAQKNKKLANKGGQDLDEREILIGNDQKLAKTEQGSPFSGQKVVPTKDKPKVSLGKTKSNKEDDSMHERKFNDYIDKVRNRLLKTTSGHIGDSSKEMH